MTETIQKLAKLRPDWVVSQYNENLSSSNLKAIQLIDTAPVACGGFSGEEERRRPGTSRRLRLSLCQRLIPAQLHQCSRPRSHRLVANLKWPARVDCGRAGMVSNSPTGQTHPFTERLTMLAVERHCEGNQKRRTVGVLCCICSLAVLTAFSLPVQTGPYTVVRGPAIAFKSAQNLECLEWSILLAALRLKGVKLVVTRPARVSRWFYADSGSCPQPCSQPFPLLC
jgi:hypothetical protein